MEAIPDLFWSYVDKTGGPNACWPWMRGNFSEGYGCVVWEDKTVGSHVVAFTLHNGAPKPGMKVLHACDNKPCCNPHHLYEGDGKQNVKDALDRGQHIKGSKHVLAKLVEQDVLDIRHQYDHKLKSQSEMAREYNVSVQLIYQVVHRKTWKHV